MAYRNQELGYLVRYRPEEARQRIAEAIEAAGSITGAAERLGVGRRSLYRWIDALNREDRANEQAKRSVRSG